MMNPVRVRDAFLANHAEVREGLAFISGAFPEWWRLNTLPATVPVSLVVVIDLDPSEIDQALKVTIRLVHPNGDRDTLGDVPFRRPRQAEDILLPGGTPFRQILACTFDVHFRMEGLHRVAITSGDEEVESVPVAVRAISTL
jgi:hypothetical protein